MIKVGLIVPVMKNFTGLAQLMRSVDYPVLPLIIDNWNVNKGVAGGWNEGIQRAKDAGCTHALIMNDDSVYEPGTIAKLIEAIDSGAGFVVSAINRRDQKEDLPFEIRPGCDYSCFILKPQEFFDTVGKFDENFYPAYFEDNDMERRILLSGNFPVHRTDAMHYHSGSGTQNHDRDNPVVTSSMFEDNRRYYHFKWGGGALEETYQRPYNDPMCDIKTWRKSK